MKRRNYKLQRVIASFTLVTSLSLAISTMSTNEITNPIPYTSADLTSNIIFSKQLEEIMNEEKIEFSNQELKEIIEEEIGGPITKENLSSITVLSITKPLTNKDLSELKYLTNLGGLLIHDNEVDLRDLKYNQNLHSIILHTCTIENTQDLPNSITSLTFKNSICKDKEVILPYYTKEFSSIGSITNNLRLKNPSALEKLYMYTDSVLDLNNIRGCTNLQELTLLRLSNVKNSSTLSYLPNLKSLTLDEYSTIWLDNKTLSTLPVDKNTKETLSTLIEKLDSISESIVNKNATIAPEYKAREIVLYLLDSFEYDYNSVKNYAVDKSGVTEYNDYPISTFLNTDLGVCINYTCLFSAIANRVGIEPFQLYTSNHTWNAIKTNEGYTCYDLSYLELGVIVRVEGKDSLAMIKDTTAQDLIREGNSEYLVYYEFDIEKIVDDYHQAYYTPEEITNDILNIGYINENCLAYIIENNQVKLHKMDIFAKSYIILSILTTLMLYISDKNHQNKLTNNQKSLY